MGSAGSEAVGECRLIRFQIRKCTDPQLTRKRFPVYAKKWLAVLPAANLRRTIMDELINMVAQRTGLAPEKARTAVDTVVGFLKDKLPAPLAGAN